ncbi:MAG: enoyl-CoA hydratase/isomerase family protein [Chloroflexi bacterium]|nr:enoyl-CoA hydratase/isomerase family protein [Chloroflexota bacterium]
MDFKNIIYEKDGRLARITMNRPDKLNAVNQAMAEDLAVAIADAAKDDAIRCVVLTGAGRAFCAGGDFRYRDVAEGKVSPDQAHDNRIAYDHIYRGHLLPGWVGTVMLPLHNLEKPTIAAVNGPCLGAGLDLACACDMRVGSPKTSFAVGFTRVGLADDMGGIWHLPKIVGLGKALELLYTSDTVDAQESYRIGLLNKLFPEDTFEAETTAFARRLSEGPPIAYRLIKAQAYRSYMIDMELALQMTMAYVSIALKSEDHHDAVRAMAAKREPVFQDKGH